MKALRRLAATVVAVALLSSPAAAGMLDLGLYGTAELPALGTSRPAWRQSRDYLPKELWLPGNPVNTRGADYIEQSISLAGNAALGGLGIMQNWGGMRHSRDERAAAIGFGLITLWNMLGLSQLWSSSGDAKKKTAHDAKL